MHIKNLHDGHKFRQLWLAGQPNDIKELHLATHAL